MNEILCSSWETYYIAARQWYLEHGNLKIPKSYVTPTGLTLGSWIQTQRRVRAGNVPGSLTEEKVKKLDEIGMIWDVSASSWEEAMEELRTYYHEHGDVDVKAKYVAPDGFRLGSWVQNLRGKVKRQGIDNVLTEEQQEQFA